MNTPERSDNHLLDLLIKEATEGLTTDEKNELRQLSYQLPDVDAHFAEDTIALLSLALIGKGDRIPGGLRDRILAVDEPAANDSDPMLDPMDDLAIARQKRNERSSLIKAAATSTAGWWTAAAALVLAVAGWWPRIVNDPGQMVASRSPVEVREELLASGRAIRASWSPAAAPESGEPLVGDVVFDPVTQRGFLTFRGIPRNDPRLAQYQLWIVDAHRKQPEPVDGGVFNVAGEPTAQGNDVVIPFEAKLPIGQPAAFVVTMEQPGGVVISKQEKVLALAKVTT
jgi:hypothetical protein